MNWRSIKNAFIALLLMANIVLLWVYVSEHRTKAPVAEETLVEDMINQLEKDGITLNETPNLPIGEIPVLSVSDADIVLDEEKARFGVLGLSPYSADNGGGYLYSCDDVGGLDIEYFGEKSGKKTLSSKQIADSCIPKPSGTTSYRFTNSTYRQDEGEVFHYEQCYNGTPILDAYIRVSVKNGLVTNLRQKKLLVKQVSGKTQRLIPYSLALYRLYSSVEEGDLPIDFSSIMLVHQLTSADGEYLISGETFPYYRFSSKDKGVYLIKALQIDTD